MEREKIIDIAKSYDRKNISIASIGSHSALDVCRGAKQEGFHTIVLCEKGREKTYSRYFRTNGSKGIVDETILLGKFSDISDDSVLENLRNKNSIFIPNRSFEVYMNFDYDSIENMAIPFFGSRDLLKVEERGRENNQYYLLEKAGIRFPRQFSSPQQIDRLAIVKASESERKFQREFFFASSYEDYRKKSQELVSKKMIPESSLENAVIEEFILGVQVNFNFFYSPLSQELELLGTDFRRQTSLDGLLRLPASEQIAISEYAKPQFKESGHVACTVLESMLEKAYDAGERFVKACKETSTTGIIGPFALQSAIIPGPPKEEIIVFDVSMRIPGSPGTMFTPYQYYLYGKPISVGQRIAMEIREAIKTDSLDKVLS